MNIQHFFDPDTFTLSYVVYDPVSRDAVIIDPVLDFTPEDGCIRSRSLEKITGFVRSESLLVHMILETHAHADHLSASQYLKACYPKATVGIGAGITIVQKAFQNVFHLGRDFCTDGSQFDFLVQDGQSLKSGSLGFRVIGTPGHTPACVSYLFEDALFTGDALFMPDYGTGRCDFPQGSASDLYHSVHEKLYALPEATRVFVGHDYLPGGRPLAFQTTIGIQRQNNIQLRSATTAADFIAMRMGRDKTLSTPRLLLPSIQVNINAGHLPEKEDNGVSYLRIPLKVDR